MTTAIINEEDSLRNHEQGCSKGEIEGYQPCCMLVSSESASGGCLMILREILLPRMPDRELLDRAIELAERAQSAFEVKSEELPELVARFNQMTGVSYEPEDFLFYGHTDADAFAETAFLVSQVSRHDDLAREELIEIVRRIQRAESEAETSYYLALLKANCPDPRVADLIYWPNEYFNRPPDVSIELSAEQIVDHALKGSKI